MALAIYINNMDETVYIITLNCIEILKYNFS